MLSLEELRLPQFAQLIVILRSVVRLHSIRLWRYGVRRSLRLVVVPLCSRVPLASRCECSENLVYGRGAV